MGGGGGGFHSGGNPGFHSFNFHSGGNDHHDFHFRSANEIFRFLIIIIIYNLQ